MDIWRVLDDVESPPDQPAGISGFHVLADSTAVTIGIARQGALDPMPARADGVFGSVPVQPGVIAIPFPGAGEFGFSLLERTLFIVGTGSITHAIGRPIVVEIIVFLIVGLAAVVFVPVGIFGRGIEAFRHFMAGAPPTIAPTTPPIATPMGPPIPPIAAPAAAPPALPSPVPNGWEPGSPVMGSLFSFRFSGLFSVFITRPDLATGGPVSVHAWCNDGIPRYYGASARPGPRWDDPAASRRIAQRILRDPFLHASGTWHQLRIARAACNFGLSPCIAPHQSPRASGTGAMGLLQREPLQRICFMDHRQNIEWISKDDGPGHGFCEEG